VQFVVLLPIGFCAGGPERRLWAVLASMGHELPCNQCRSVFVGRVDSSGSDKPRVVLLAQLHVLITLQPHHRRSRLPPVPICVAAALDSAVGSGIHSRFASK